MASMSTGGRRRLTFRVRCRHDQQDISIQHTGDGADEPSGSQPEATRSSTSTSTSASLVEPSGPGTLSLAPSTSCKSHAYHERAA